MTTTNPQETLEPKLKRCPFCGGLAIKGMFNVWCDNCRAQTARDVDATEAEVIEQWNTRVRDSAAATVDEEVGQDFTKHLMQRHQELALHVRQECAKVIELIEQYSRFDFYMWLTHDPSGLNSDPCKRAAEAKDILQRLIDSKPHERAAPSLVALRDEARPRAIFDAGFAAHSSPSPRELAQAAANEIASAWFGGDTMVKSYSELRDLAQPIILRTCFSEK